MGRILVVGSINQDLRATMDRLPGPGETVIGRTLDRAPGGKGANQAVAAAIASSPTGSAGVVVSMLGAVGDDEAGRGSVAVMAAHGVDVEHVTVVADAPTGTAIIQLDADGENSIVVIPGANHAVTEADLAPVDALVEGDVLLLQLELPLPVVAAAARRAAAAGARVVINMAPFASLDADVIGLADPLIVNEHEAAQLAEAGLVVTSLVTTLGARGATWADLHVPAEPVDVVDSTGAGDSFCGALAAALASGADRQDAMRAASAAAARTVGHLGAQPEPGGAQPESDGDGAVDLPSGGLPDARGAAPV